MWAFSTKLGAGMRILKCTTNRIWGGGRGLVNSAQTGDKLPR